MEPEVPVKKLETMVKLDAVRHQSHACWEHVPLPMGGATSFGMS